MKKSILVMSIACISNATHLHAAALERSGQSILPFLQSGNYFEAGLTSIDPKVSGAIKPEYNKGGLTAAANMPTGNIAENYYFPHAAIKFQLNENFSLGFIYDQPFGAKASYPIGKYPAYTFKGESTSAEVKSENLSAIVGYQPNQNWNIYAGAVAQTVEGNAHLRGASYSWAIYDMDAPKTTGYGWLAGAAFSIPEIALRAAVTYRSEIDHDISTSENITFPTGVGATGPIYGPQMVFKEKSTITTPQSINVDLQSGIMKDTVAFANLRWVDWSSFTVTPLGLYNLVTLPSTGKGVDLAAYYDDQFSASIGVGHQFSEKWAGSVSAGWDSGAGNLVSTLGPTEGYYSAGLGIKYNPAPNYDISFGAKYFWLGDAKAQSGFDFATEKYDAIYTNNKAIAYGLKIGYKF